MTEIELHRPHTDLAQQMDFAKAVSTGSLLPDAYRGKPANVLIAVGLGSAMGLSPAESLYRIDVIGGKPTASAELIAANVRKAGHKLRIQIDEANQSVTATILRVDDPDFPFTVTRDCKWAQDMGLLNKDNYKKQLLTMLQWRAISGVARLACPEALYGVVYTADEVGDFPSTSNAPAGGLASALAQQDEAEPEPEQGLPALTDRTRKALFALMTDVGITDADDQRAFLSDTLGRVVESRSSLTEPEGVAAGQRLRRIQKGDHDAAWTSARSDTEAQQQQLDEEPA